MTDPITDPLDAQPLVQEPIQPPAPEPEAQTEPRDLTKAEVQKALGDIYTEATKRLRVYYADEFNALRKTLADQRGIPWTPKLSKSEKARADIERIAAEAGLTVSWPKASE